MTRVSDSGFEVTGRTTIICDYSPHRSGLLAQAPPPPKGADFLLVNCNPGRSVRADSAMLAAALKQQNGQEVVFALLTRDMNRLAIQSYLLGAQLAGLENVVVAEGDPFTEREAGVVKAVRDYRPTELIEAISDMNRGRDFRGRNLSAPTNLCVGATLDPGGDMGTQVNLAKRKVDAGAQFLISQPVFDPKDAAAFEMAYEERAGLACPVPIYWGLQMLEAGSVSFGKVPPEIRDEVEAGRSGVDAALEVFERLSAGPCRNIYLLPSIRRGGERGYEAVQEFMQQVRTRES